MGKKRFYQDGASEKDIGTVQEIDDKSADDFEKTEEDDFGDLDSFGTDEDDIEDVTKGMVHEF